MNFLNEHTQIMTISSNFWRKIEFWWKFWRWVFHNFIQIIQIFWTDWAIFIYQFWPWVLGSSEKDRIDWIFQKPFFSNLHILVRYHSYRKCELCNIFSIQRAVLLEISENGWFWLVDVTANQNLLWNILFEFPTNDNEWHQKVRYRTARRSRWIFHRSLHIGRFRLIVGPFKILEKIMMTRS